MKKHLLAVSLCLASVFAQAQISTVYALQDGSDTGMADVKSHLTTLNIDASAISGAVKSISVYANGKESISGPVIVNSSGVSTPGGNAPSAYASNGQSDVVMVSGGSKTCTAYLLPVNLQKGVKVTVQTEDGKFYSQDFTSIDTGGSNNLTITNQTANNLWMATIPGNTYFSFLSTPGAHDAATSGVTSYTSSSRCQDMTIEGLLNAGVRCFDIRPGYYYTTTISADNLYIYHGQVSTNVLYKDAMKTLADFVQNNPSEAITIVMVKENCKPTLDLSRKWTDRSSEMWAVVNAVQEQYKSLMKVLDHSYYTLDDFRGKICYINRTGTSVPYTTQITNWPDNGTNYGCTAGLCNANVQDEYNKNGPNKQNAVKDMLELSSGNIAYKNIYFNYCSSANSPASYAKATNPVISEYLAGENIAGPTGYLLADFIGSSNNGGAALLSAIINQNYRYVYNGRSSADEKPADDNWDLVKGSDVNWTKKGNWADGHGAASDVHVTENYAGWGSLEQTDFALLRDVALPAGTYKMTGYALYRDGASAKLVAKSGSTILSSVNVAPMTSISTVGANDLEKAANAFTGENYLNTLSFTLTEPTMVTVGFEGKHTATRQWFVAGPVTLEKIDVPANPTACLKITAAKWGTFCAPFNVAVPDGVKAYTVEIEGDKLVYAEAESIEADKAYAVFSESPFDETYEGESIASGNEVKTGCLVGTYKLIDAPQDSYLLQNNGGKIGFYRVADEGLTVGANRCYLVNESPSAAAKTVFLLDEGEEATAIEALNAIMNGNVEAIYNANGVQQNGMQKGVNVVKITNGKTAKVMVK